MEKIIILVLLLVLAPLTTWLLWRELSFMRSCTVVSGQVVSLRTSVGKKGGKTYAPDVALTLPDGTGMVYQHQTYSSPASFHVGELVPLGCVGHEVRMLYFMNRFGLPLILGSLTLALLLYLGGRAVFERHVGARIAEQLRIER